MDSVTVRPRSRSLSENLRECARADTLRIGAKLAHDLRPAVLDVVVHRIGRGDILAQQERRAGTQDAQGLAQRFTPFRHEVQYVDRDHGVEGGVCERQRGHIGDLDREASCSALT